ncbi:hypothetical protein Tco_0247538 [Tanacetum coccineum]
MSGLPILKKGEYTLWNMDGAYQLRFHGIKDAKSLWAAIKSRFGGNVESKKMRKTVLKLQFENFSVFDTDGLDKAYDRVQKLISLLEVHGVVMTTLAELIIVVRAENRPPMLEKSMYDSWTSRIRLFIKGKKHGRMMLDSVDNGPLVYPTVEENGQTRSKKYSELTEA